MTFLRSISSSMHLNVQHAVLTQSRGIATTVRSDVSAQCACGWGAPPLKFRTLVKNQGLYVGGKEFLCGCKEAQKDDFSRPDTSCKAALIMCAELYNMTQERQQTSGNNITHFNPSEARLLLSAFMRDLDKGEGTTDRTGERGYLANKMIEQHKLGPFSRVIDLGGQDDSFVRLFHAKRTVVDINIATPFFSKEPGIEYIIDSAINAVMLDTLHRTNELGQRLFAMSNLLNVLPPKEGLKLLTDLTSKMHSKDTLVITGLALNHFKKKKLHAIVDEKNGLHSVLKKGSFYKTAITTNLLASWLENTLGMDVLDKQETELLLKKSFPVSFATILLRRN